MGSPQNNSRKAPINNVPSGKRSSIVPRGTEGGQPNKINSKNTGNLSRLNQK